jgi:hypothetical protein
MDKEPFPFPVHEVLLHFGNVVTDVIDDVHVQVVGRGLEHLGEGLSRQECHAAPVDPGEVGRRRHTVQVLLPLLPPKEGYGNINGNLGTPTAERRVIRVR